MNNNETQFWKSVTQLGQLPGIVILLVITTFPALANIQQIYYSVIYQGTLGLNTRPLILGWGGIFVSYWVGTIIKYLHYKPRPIPRDTSTTRKRINAGSMPSIHASNAVICGFVFTQSWISYPLMDNVMTQYFILIMVGIFIFMSISLSRIALDKHYPIDVLVGSIFGSIIITVLSINSDSIIALLDHIINIFL